VLADLGGPLREVLFPAFIDDTGFAVMLPPGHPATRLLPGSPIDIIGPTGRGFRPGNAQRLLLVSSADMLPLLLPLLAGAPNNAPFRNGMSFLNGAPSIALVIEGATRAQLPLPEQIPPAVELTLVTLDGSAGYLGPLESQEPAPAGLERVGPYLLELIAWAECACFACNNDRYPALASLVRQVRIQPAPDFAQALVRVEMPCGVGVCEVCRIATRHGEKCACTDGPVFDLLELGYD